MSTESTTTRRVLLLDHATSAAAALAARLAAEGFGVLRAEDAESALAALDEGGLAVVVVEISLGGDALLREALRLPDGPPVILLDDFGSLSEALAAVRRGAFDTIVRPADDEQVLLAVRRAVEGRRLRAENRALRDALDQRHELGGIASRDARMRRVFETILAVAGSRVPLLLSGESGTGKSVLAREVHEHSGRPDAPFVVVDCGALPASLLESELFGHVRGAYTGAVRDREGKFEAADGGTLFLDEIASASLDLQAKLLRVIEEGRFERVGETRTRAVDVRVIAASNRDLEAEVAAGRFREDLYWRIHVVAIELPPLRERPADVAHLAERFLERFARRHGRAIEGFEPDALQALWSHAWPGNVRELENTVERAVLLTRGTRIAARDLGSPGAWAQESPPAPGGPIGSHAPDGPPAWAELPEGPIKDTLAIVERWLIERALERCGGQRQEAARALGINRTTLFNKMKTYRLLSFPRRMRGAGGGGGPERGGTG